MSETVQRLTCQQSGAAFEASHPQSLFGYAIQTERRDAPLHGLRHTPSDQTSGWYIWRGEYSAAKDFFSPLHIQHAQERCPDAIPFLGLPEGWRFLLKGEHIDVWFDQKLIEGHIS